MQIRILCSLILSGALACSTAVASSQAAMPTPARVAYPGGLDRTFGNAGRAPAPADERILLPIEWGAVAVQPDGKIVVVGNDASAFVVVARYDPSGVLDPTFGSAGVVTLTLPHGGQAKALALVGRAEIVVVGMAYRDVDTGTDVFALRLTADGSLDPGFAGGVVTVDLGEEDDATAVVTQSDERIVILADTNRRDWAMPSGAVVLLGLRPDGTLDPTFGRDGMTRFAGTPREALHAEGMVQDSDTSLVIPVNASEDGPTRIELRTIRFDRNGVPVQTFDPVSGSAEGIGLLSDGTVIVHGYSRNGSGVTFIAFFRFESDGALDPGFGDGGILASSELLAGRIVVDDDDRVIVAAGSQLTRHNADGELDVGFGAEGFASTPAFTGYDNVVLQPDGKIIGVGGGCFHDLPHGVSCATSLDRYESDVTRLCGDADADGVFSVTDGVATLRAAAGLGTVCIPTVCDVNGSGSIDVTDAVNVLRAAADLQAGLTCGIPDH